jgi:tetratricopeptide (TPR) repeat protein
MARADPDGSSLERAAPLVAAARWETYFSEPAVRIDDVNRLRNEVRQRPDDVDAWYELAAAVLEDGALEEAHELMFRVLERAPDHRGAHRALALIQESMGRIPEAIALWRRLVELSEGDDAEALTGLGNALSKDGQHEEAARILADVAGRQGPAELGMASIKGDLRTFNLLDVLEFLRVQGQSGALMVSSARGEGVVHLALGRVTGAAAPGVEPAGQFPVDQAPEGEELGRIMAAMAELLEWREGAFAFHSASHEPPPAVSFDLQAIMLRLAARRDEMSPGS